jgi:hypothetical protein
MCLNYDTSMRGTYGVDYYTRLDEVEVKQVHAKMIKLEKGLKMCPSCRPFGVRG